MTPARPRAALVRPHVVTRGRTRTRREFDLATLVTAADHAATALPRGANPEQVQIMALCRSGVLSVADIAGHLGLAVGFTKILLDDLVASGHVATLAPAPESPSLELLQEVLDGLHRL